MIAIRLVEGIFWLSIFLIAHSYVIFPLHMKRRVPRNRIPEQDVSYSPCVSIMMSVYNEEKVLVEKLESVLATSYPSNLWEIVIGSDGSTDRTNSILSDYATKYPDNIKVRIFEYRSGKSQVLNKLVPCAKGEILVLTDADALFFPDTLSQLIRPFQDENVGGVQAYLQRHVVDSNHIGAQEKAYHARETMIKSGESSLGAVIGAEGACYAMRKDLYVPIPENFINDDFFIFMNILKQGFKNVLNTDASCICYISGSEQVQFVRKVRMGTGNYQIFFRFAQFLNPFKGFVSYAYISHKVLRWFTPFFMLAIFAAGLWLAFQNTFYTVLFVIQAGGYAVALSDALPPIRSLNIKLLRFVRHFIFMNAAFVVGFVNFITNKKKVTWNHARKS